ncbi:MAG: hypothetical protein ACLT98_17740 [Eggerthellaceae bacterium]
MLTVPVSRDRRRRRQVRQVYDLASGEQRVEPVTTGVSNGTMVEGMRV